MDISTPFDLAILARSDCIVHPHKTKLLCQCHCSENNSDQKSKNSTHSRSKKCKSRSRSPEVFAIVTSSNLMSSSSSNNEGIVIEFFEFMSDCLFVGKFSCYSDLREINFGWFQWKTAISTILDALNFDFSKNWLKWQFSTFWNQPKVISRKIRVIGKLLNLHTVYSILEIWSWFLREINEFNDNPIMNRILI